MAAVMRGGILQLFVLQAAAELFRMMLWVSNLIFCRRPLAIRVSSLTPLCCFSIDCCSVQCKMPQDWNEESRQCQWSSIEEYNCKDCWE